MFRPNGIEGIPQGVWMSESTALIRFWEGEQCRQPILRISADA